MMQTIFLELLITVAAIAVCVGVFFLLPELLVRAFASMPDWPQIRRALLRYGIGMGVFAGLVLLVVWELTFFATLGVSIVLLYLGFRRGNTDRRRKVADLLQELSLALKHRLPPQDVLDALVQEEHGEEAERILSVSKAVQRGEILSNALNASRCLPVHALAALRAGEAGGGEALEPTLLMLSRELRAEASQNGRAWFAIFYPLAVIAVCLPIAAFLFTFILPQMLYILKYMHLSRAAILPLYFAPFALALLLLLAFWHTRWEDPISFYVWQRLQHLTQKIEDLLPFFRARLRHRSLERGAAAMATMIGCSVPLHEAARRAGDAGISGPYAKAFNTLATAAERGEPLDAALRQSGLPQAFVSLAQAGAAGGEMSVALRTCSEWYRSRADRADNFLTALLPCVSVPLAGIFVGSIYASIFGIWGTVVNEMIQRTLRH